jgi:hypothetical protein
MPRIVVHLAVSLPAVRFIGFLIELLPPNELTCSLISSFFNSTNFDM